jgi:hypothetical protein
MRIDNSQANTFRKCPLKEREKYHERYPGSELVGIEPAVESTDLQFGARMHQLLHEHRARLKGVPIKEFPPLVDDKLEKECQSTYAAYLAHYPVEPWEVVEAEKTYVVPLWRPHEEEVAWSMGLEGQQVGPKHELVVKLDAIVRNQHGILQVMETKNQRRSSQNNDAEHWAARPQVALYIYAARHLWPKEKISDEIILDLIRRQSPTGLLGPEFHRDSPRRSPCQIEEAVRDIVWVADRIEEAERTGFWPGFRDNCKIGNWKCDYYSLHNSPDAARADLLRKFRPAEPYLEEV